MTDVLSGGQFFADAVQKNIFERHFLRDVFLRDVLSQSGCILPARLYRGGENGAAGSKDAAALLFCQRQDVLLPSEPAVPECLIRGQAREGDDKYSYRAKKCIARRSFL